MNDLIVGMADFWWFIVPAFFSIGFAALGICSFFFGKMYCFLNRSDEYPWNFTRRVASMLFPEDFEEHATGYNYHHNSKCPWYYLELGENGSGNYEYIWIFCVIIWPMALVWVLGLLQLTPVWGTFAVLSTVAGLFIGRLAIDGLKKANSVLSQLDKHKQDLDAHQKVDGTTEQVDCVYGLRYEKEN